MELQHAMTDLGKLVGTLLRQTKVALKQPPNLIRKELFIRTIRQLTMIVDDLPVLTNYAPEGATCGAEAKKLCAKVLRLVTARTVGREDYIQEERDFNKAAIDFRNAFDDLKFFASHHPDPYATQQEEYYEEEQFNDGFGDPDYQATSNQHHGGGYYDDGAAQPYSDIDDLERDMGGMSVGDDYASFVNSSPRSNANDGTFASSKGFLSSAPGYNPHMVHMSPSPRNPDPEVQINPSPPRSPRNQPVATSTSNTPQGEWKTDWKCPKCTVVNERLALRCTMCGEMRPSPEEMAAMAKAASNIVEESNEWECGSCGVHNANAAKLCRMCGSSLRVAEKPKPEKSNRAKLAVTSSKKGLDDKGKGRGRGRARKTPGVKPKRKIVSKANSKVELQYAKGVDVFVYKAGSSARPGHGAGY